MKKCFPILTAAVALCLFGCSKSQTSEVVEAPTNTLVEDAVPSSEAQSEANAQKTEPKAGEGIVVADEVDADLVRQWVVANNDFGLKMLRNVETKQSLVVSPYSAERVLGMTLDGAVGETASELRTALCLPDAQNLSAAGAAIEKAIFSDDRDKDAVLHVSNRLWVNNHLSLLSSYTSGIKANYGAEPMVLDFANDPEGCRATINNDVAKTTENKILDLLKPGMINTMTRSVLTNAIYFKAPWMEKFEKSATTKDTFYAASGEIQIDMMKHVKSHAYMSNDEMTALELDFKGDYSLLIAMPNLENNGKGLEALAAMEQELTGEKFTAIHQQMRESGRSELDLTMPKFRIEYDDSLVKLLSLLGVKTAFDENKADFSGMVSNNSLYISNVIQKAYIDVNEEGAEAAAATAVIMMTRALRPKIKSDPIVVKVDHPFVYALMDVSTGTALFLGRYVGEK